MQANIGKIVTKTISIPRTNIVLEINPDTIIMTGLVMAILLVLVLVVRRRLSFLPDRVQLGAELLINWFDETLQESLGEDRRKFLPLILTLFLFVLLSNWLGLIPALRSPTRDLNTCLGLGLLVFLVSHTNAIKKKGLKRYLASYFKPFWFLFPSNVFSEASKVLSHSFRLFGNIFAGGIIISVIPLILVQIFKFFAVPLGILAMPAINGFFILFIGGIQAFVFSLLALAYISVLQGD